MIAHAGMRACASGRRGPDARAHARTHATMRACVCVRVAVCVRVRVCTCARARVRQAHALSHMGGRGARRRQTR
eukprot:4905030-Pleurochrysis_carterae.AAC.1